MRPVDRSIVNTVEWRHVFVNGVDEVQFEMLAEEGAFHLHDRIRFDGDVYRITSCAIRSRITFSGACIWVVVAERLAEKEH